MKELLLGTTNPAKVMSRGPLSSPYPLKIVTPDGLGLKIDVQEDRRTTAENAETEARAYFVAARTPNPGY